MMQVIGREILSQHVAAQVVKRMHVIGARMFPAF